MESRLPFFHGESRVKEYVLLIAVLVVLIAGIGYCRESRLKKTLLEVEGRLQAQVSADRLEARSSFERVSSLNSRVESLTADIVVLKARESSLSVENKELGAEKRLLVRSLKGSLDDRRHVTVSRGSSTRSGSVSLSGTWPKAFSSKSACDAFWFPHVVKAFSQYGINTATNRRRALSSIYCESRGDASAHTQGTSYYGLLQFGKDWVRGMDPSQYGTSVDWRMNPETSLRRMAQSISVSSSKWSHWSQTAFRY